jgi:hypothetical protein
MTQQVMEANDLIPTALVATGTSPAAIPHLAPALPGSHKDRFANEAGPDVSFKGPDGLTEAYAVFQIDPQTKQLEVVVVDSEGQVLRVIPPRSVSEMIESMSRYRP